MAEPEILSACPFCGYEPQRHDGDYVLNHANGCFFTQHYAQEMWLVGQRPLKQWNSRAGAPKRGTTDGEAVGCSAWVAVMEQEIKHAEREARRGSGGAPGTASWNGLAQGLRTALQKHKEITATVPVSHSEVATGTNENRP